MSMNQQDLIGFHCMCIVMQQHTLIALEQNKLQKKQKHLLGTKLS